MSADDGSPDFNPRSSASAGRPVDALDLGLLSLLFVIAAAVGWGIVDPVKYEVLAAFRSGASLRGAVVDALIARAAPLTATVLMSGAAVLFLVVREARHRALSGAIQASPGAWIAVLLGCCLLWFGHAYLYPGWMLAGDANAHVARIAQLGSALRDGEWPVWSNRFYLGAPFLQFTGPLFFQFGGILAAILGDGMLATKILLFALHLASGFGAYAFLRRLDADRFAAITGSLAYTGAWAHLHLFVYAGVFPQAVTLALLPVAFAAAESCLRRRQSGLRWDWAVLALSAAGLLANHQPHGLLAGIYLAAYCLWRWRGLGGGAAIWRVAWAGAIGVVAASYAIAPYLLERHTVMAVGASGVITFDVPTLDELAKLVRWSNGLTSTGQESAAYLGLAAILLGLTGAVAGTRDLMCSRRVMAGVPFFAVALVASLFISGAFVRDIQFTLFFLSPLCARGMMVLSTLPCGRAGTAALCAIAVMLLDIGPTALQPLNRTDKTHYVAALDYLEARHPAGRVVLVGSGSWRHAHEAGFDRTFAVASASPLAWGSVSFVTGPHDQEATPAFVPANAVLLRLERELNEGAVGAETLRLLALLDVGRVIYDDGTAFGFPDGLPDTVPEGPLGRILAVPQATPVLFAPALAPVDIAPADAPLLWPTMGDTAIARQAEAVALADLATLAPDFPRGLATAIAVPAGSEPAGAESLPPGVALRLVAFSEGRQTVTARLETPAAGFVRLAYAAHPWVWATVNGETVTPIRTLTGLIAVPVPAGVVEIALGAEASSLRRGFTILSLAAFVGVLATPWIGRLSGRGRSTKSPLRDRGRL